MVKFCLTPLSEGCLLLGESVVHLADVPQLSPSLPPESLPATMLTQLQDSDDSEAEDHVPLRRVLQKRKILSDDEDD